jgi:hypothetical protein
MTERLCPVVIWTEFHRAYFAVSSAMAASALVMAATAPALAPPSPARAAIHSGAL